MTLPDLSVTLAGRKPALFWLALRTSLLTVLTLGLYRFWMKTRLRRWYWSSVRPGGLPLEYTGEPLEKLLGFLIAVVFLAFYIGLVNLVLVFLSVSFLQGVGTAYAISFIGLVPVIFYARYRARRYVLGRTRWRGIRFGMEPAAWGYTWRALAHWAVTILSLGVLWPRMTFWLEKYRADRTFYGTLKVTQGGSWPRLYRAAVHLVIGLVLVAAGGGMLAGLLPKLDLGGWRSDALGPLLIGLGGIWAVFGLVHYRVHSFRILTAAKRLDGGAGLLSRARTWRVLTIYVVGHLVAGLLLTFVLLPLGGLLLLVVGDALLRVSDGEEVLDLMAQLPVALSAGLGALLYFAVFTAWGALRQVFVTLPLIHHYAGTLVIVSPLPLTRVRQRAGDRFDEAEGFADALDLGAAL